MEWTGQMGRKGGEESMIKIGKEEKSIKFKKRGNKRRNWDKTGISKL
jgi:hypothetical protein